MESTFEYQFKERDSRFRTFANMKLLNKEPQEQYWLGCIPDLYPASNQSFHISTLQRDGNLTPDEYYDQVKNAVKTAPVMYADHQNVLPRLHAFQKQKTATVLYLFKDHVQSNGEQQVHLVLPTVEGVPLGIELGNPYLQEWIKLVKPNHEAFLVLATGSYPDYYFKRRR